MKIFGNGAVIDGANIVIEKGDKFSWVTLIRCNIDDVENAPFDKPVFESCILKECTLRSQYEAEKFFNSKQ